MSEQEKQTTFYEVLMNQADRAIFLEFVKKFCSDEEKLELFDKEEPFKNPVLMNKEHSIGLVRTKDLEGLMEPITAVSGQRLYNALLALKQAKVLNDTIVYLTGHFKPIQIKVEEANLSLVLAPLKEEFDEVEDIVEDEK